MATSTRYIGFCPVCQRQIKVRDGLLVHHGYERPGTGEIVGDCFGVNRPPHELSPDTAMEYLWTVVANRREDAERRIINLGPPNEPEVLFFDEYQREEWGRGRYVPVPRRRGEVSEYDWERQLKIARVNAANILEFWQGESKRLSHLVETWQPQPLLTVEEETVKLEEARAERTRRLTAERETKLAEALVSLQQRLDSAVRNKRPGTIQNLYEDGYRKLYDISRGELRQPDVLRLVDRDHVWRAFGLVADDGSYVLDHRAIHQAFSPWSPYGGGSPAPFPAELGGGKAKLSR